MTTVLKFLLIHFTYFALIAILVAAGLGVPIPEDVPLILAGHTCNKDHSLIPQVVKNVDTDGDGIPDKQVVEPPKVPNLYLMMVSGMVGVLLGDSVVFFIGRRGIDSNNFVARHIRKVLHSKRREKVERHFTRHGLLTVFAGRFMPGFRSPVFAMAGMSRMSYWKFLCVDGLAAAISVPTFIFIGHHFAEHITEVFNFIHRTKAILTPIALAVVIGGIIFYWFYRRRPKAAPVTEAPLR